MKKVDLDFSIANIKKINIELFGIKIILRLNQRKKIL